MVRRDEIEHFLYDCGYMNPPPPPVSMWRHPSVSYCWFPGCLLRFIEPQLIQNQPFWRHAYSWTGKSVMIQVNLHKPYMTLNSLFLMCIHRPVGMQKVRLSLSWRLWRLVGPQGLYAVLWKWWSRGSISTLSHSFLTLAYSDTELWASVSLEQHSNKKSAGTVLFQSLFTPCK